MVLAVPEVDATTMALSTREWSSRPGVPSAVAVNDIIEMRAVSEWLVVLLTGEVPEL